MNPIYATIYKVDERTREVSGRATQEVVDRDDEVMDYASSKPEFMRWSAEVFKDTGGRSHGNVRSMHGNTAAGKLTDIQFLDAERAIDVTAKIVDDNEWQKICEGVYGGFSIGGRYARKWAQPIDGKMVQHFTAVPSEISIVDRPSCPTAKFFSVHKRDGSVVRRRFATHNFVDAIFKMACRSAALRKATFPPQSRNAQWDNVHAETGAGNYWDDEGTVGAKEVKPAMIGGHVIGKPAQSNIDAALAAIKQDWRAARSAWGLRTYPRDTPD